MSAFIESIRLEIRTRHYSLKTEKTYFPLSLLVSALYSF